MRRRLYFLLPDLRSAEIIEDELLLARIDEGHIHALATLDKAVGKLPEANLFQRTDFYHGLVLGLASGGLTGTIIGILLLFYPAFQPAQSPGIILLMALLGAVFGAWAGTMIAVGIPNSRLKVFEGAIQKGRILLMVDVPKERVAEITELVRSHHPEADVRGIEPTIPAFP